MSKQSRTSSCSECPSVFELIPPADERYTEPREKPTSDDYIKRIYECEEERHRNTIYWEKRRFRVITPTTKPEVELSSTVIRDY